MTAPEISGIAPLFIANDVPATLAFYRDRLGFDITFQGPEPDDIFFGIVQSFGRAAFSASPDWPVRRSSSAITAPSSTFSARSRTRR